MVRIRTQFILLIVAAIFSFPSSDAALTFDGSASQFITIGKTLSITCTDDATNPEPFEGWFDTSGNKITAVEDTAKMYISNNGNKHKLTLAGITQSMAGEYTCKTSTEQKIWTVKIEFTFDPSVVPEQDLVLNKNSLISCAILGGYPIPTFEWKKEKVVIDFKTESRFALMKNGSMQVKQVRKSDAAKYSCLVVQDGRSQEMKFTVSVIDPPKFVQQPISKSGTLTQKVSFNCKAVGSPEPTIKWYDTNEITSANRIKIDADNTLIITNIKETDDKEYRCEASNRAGTISISAFLMPIYTAPSITKMTTVSADEGENKDIECVVTGNPTPTPVWTKAGKTLKQDSAPGRSTLKLVNVQISDTGVYTCEASNAARDENGDQIIAREDVTFYVKSKPVIDTKKTTTEVYSWVGNTKPIKLVCVSSGFPIPDFAIRNNNQKVQGTETKDGGTYTLELTVDQEAQMGDYTCVATNTYGQDSAIIRVLKASVPTVPLNLKLVVSCNQVTAKWDKPGNDGGVPIKYYSVNLKKDGEIINGQNVDGLLHMHTFEGLERQQTYTVELGATNDVGPGDLVIGTEVTLYECPPSKPEITSPKSENVDSNKFELTWTKSVKDGNDNDITYDVMYAVYNIDGSNGVWTTKSAGSSLSHDVVDLAFNEKYSFKVVAKNSGGESPSTVRHYTTPSDVPVAGKRSGLDGGAVAGIVIAIILIVLIVVDLFCCFFNECGFIHCCCQTFFSQGGGSSGSKYAADEKKAASGKEAQPLNKDPEPAVV